MNRKEPYPNLSWPLYILFVAVGCVLAKVLLDVFISSYDGIFGNIYVYDILLLVYGFVSCVLFYQIGKAIFAKIAGFDILYFNLFLIGFKKENGKFKIYPGIKEGLSVKVEIVPHKGKKQNITLALWGGSIMLAIVIALTYGLVYGLATTKAVKGFFTLSSVFYFFSFLAYMLPIKLDSINDGFSLMLIRKYNLREVYLSNLRNLRAMYDKNYELEYVDVSDHNDPLSMEARIYNFRYAVRKNDEELLKVTAEALSSNFKFAVGEESSDLCLVGQAYLMCLNGQFEELKEYFWKLDASSRRVLRTTKKLESLKVSLYISGKVDDSREGLSEVVHSVERAAKSYKYSGQKEAEVTHFLFTKEKIYKENPELVIDTDTQTTLEPSVNWAKEVKENNEEVSSFSATINLDDNKDDKNDKVN